MKNLLTPLLLLFSFYSIAQNNQSLDSLLKEADKDLPDSVKLSIYNKIGDIYIDNNALKAVGYFEKVTECEAESHEHNEEENE